MQEHIRTCRGCNQKEDRKNLLRYVLSHDKTTLIFDSGKKMSGRGMWLHDNSNCVKRAIKRGGVNHAFKTSNINYYIQSEFTRCDS